MDDEQSDDAESLDLARLPSFPQARQNVKDIESDSQVSDVFTVRESFAPGRGPVKLPQFSDERKNERALSMRHKKIRSSDSFLEATSQSN